MDGIVVVRIEDHQNGPDVFPVPDTLHDGAFYLPRADHLVSRDPKRTGYLNLGTIQARQQAPEEDRHGLFLGMSFDDGQKGSNHEPEGVSVNRSRA